MVPPFGPSFPSFFVTFFLFFSLLMFFFFPFLTSIAARFLANMSLFFIFLSRLPRASFFHVFF